MNNNRKMGVNVLKITVVTLTYRKFEKLYDTVYSVLKQNYGNIEYIICDDGSDNFPIEGLRKYINVHKKTNVSIKILQNTVNLGTVKTINRAYKEATGKYIINLSCGDVFFTNTVLTEIVSRFLQTNAKVLVTSRILYEKDYKPLCLLPHFEERKILRKLDTSLKQYKAFILSRTYDMASGSAMYFRNDIIKQYGYFDEKYRLWEDGPFLAKYLWNDKLEMAYDIVSIWYETGGISNDYSHPSSDMMREDMDLFVLEDRMAHLKCFTKSEQERIKGSTKRSVEKNMWKIWLFRFMDFRNCLSSLIYMIQRNFFKHKDKKYIGKIIKNNQDKILPNKNKVM